LNKKFLAICLVVLSLLVLFGCTQSNTSASVNSNDSNQVAITSSSGSVNSQPDLLANLKCDSFFPYVVINDAFPSFSFEKEEYFREVYDGVNSLNCNYAYDSLPDGKITTYSALARVYAIMEPINVPEDERPYIQSPQEIVLSSANDPGCSLNSVGAASVICTSVFQENTDGTPYSNFSEVHFVTSNNRYSVYASFTAPAGVDQAKIAEALAKGIDQKLSVQ